jgi:hypothetical protein
VREVHLKPEPDRNAIVEDILHMKLPAMEWEKVRKEVETGHARLS